MNFGSLKMYIGGALVAANQGKKQTILCPATEEPIAEVAWADETDALKALDAAQTGFKYWSALSLSERTQWMSKLRTAILEKEMLLRQAIIHEMGKTYSGAYEDIEAITNALEFYPKAMAAVKDEEIPDQENTHNHFMVHQAAGVAVAYLAWNFPLLNVGFKIGPALASGCSLIIKPSELSPVSSYLLGEILHEINFPAGVVNILCGPPEKVATTMTKSNIPSVITMIGSTRTGKQVIADSSSTIKKLSMELGGNAPFIVFDDADKEAALDLAIGIKFGNCGQICVAANRFFIHEKIYDEFLQAYLNRVEKLQLGFGKDSTSDMGPLVSLQAQQRMIDIVSDATAKGAKIEAGGKIPEGFDKGYWFEPTVLSNVTTEMRVYREETFGPIAPIFKFKTEDEVLAMANDTEYGLASYLFTNDLERQARFANELQFGEVQINGVKYAIYLPHGGIKNSGIGHDCSTLALDDYLIKKRVTKTL
ncbi:MAG: NAD-dependent succinate-semialdehyde dehydrogenase [Flavobacteriaceae bacterium]|jgi:succinate-semialdehyde dehydrogenase/glutarate-semialdehyde dehydrogenase